MACARRVLGTLLIITGVIAGYLAACGIAFPVTFWTFVVCCPLVIINGAYHDPLAD